MPQISLYIDEPTLKKAENAAKRRNVSLSKWVAEQIRAKVSPMYPAGFEALYGSIDDETFIEPSELSASADLPRESL